MKKQWFSLLLARSAVIIIDMYAVIACIYYFWRHPSYGISFYKEYKGERRKILLSSYRQYRQILKA